MIETHPKWTKEEFIAFILIYASYADLNFSLDERVNIEKLVSKSQFIDILEEYHSCANLEKIKIIEIYQPQYFNSKNQKTELIAIIENQFQIDNNYGIFEKELMKQLKRIIYAE